MADDFILKNEFHPKFRRRAEISGHEIHSARGLYNVLRQDIVTLRYKPGEKLSENDLAKRFGTSRAPVREALIRLGEDGLIDIRPQRGSFVSRISLKAMERARFTREALEIAIIRRAAEKGLTEKRCHDIEQAIAGQLQSGQDAEQFSYYDDLFHSQFATSVGLEGVWHTIEREKVQFDRIRFLSLPNITPVDLLIDQHRSIYKAVLEQQPQKAEAAMRIHMSEVLRIFDRLFANHPELIMDDLG